MNGLWKGLGYYSRAARLLSGAQKAVKDFGGRLPNNAQDMEAKIPGIGRYSAGAICSIAYNQCVPVVSDENLASPKAVDAPVGSTHSDGDCQRWNNTQRNRPPRLSLERQSPICPISFLRPPDPLSPRGRDLVLVFDPGLHLTNRADARLRLPDSLTGTSTGF